MEFILFQKNQRERWNQFVAGHPNNSILQSYEWAVVKEGAWKPYFTAVVEGESILAVALILKRNLPLVGKTIFYSPRGPLFQERNPELARFFFQNIRVLAQKEKAILFRCDPEIPEGNSEFINLLTSNGLIRNEENVQPRGTIILDIRPSEEELLKTFHHKTRYNIKLAEKKGVVIEEMNSDDGVNLFYDLFQITGDRDKFLILQKKYFSRLRQTLSDKGFATIMVAKFEGQALGAVLLTAFGKRMTYLYGASSNAHRNLMPNHLLHWRAIQWGKSHDIEFYDFWGIPGNPSEKSPLWGVYRFKKGFCETETKWIGTFDLVISPFWTFCFEKGSKFLKNVLRFLKTGRWGDSLHE